MSLVVVDSGVVNPNTGRFLTTDPIPGGNPNPYTYPVDPINGYDLSGTFSWGGIISGVVQAVMHPVAAIRMVVHVARIFMPIIFNRAKRAIQQVRRSPVYRAAIRTAASGGIPFGNLIAYLPSHLSVESSACAVGCIGTYQSHDHVAVTGGGGAAISVSSYLTYNSNANASKPMRQLSLWYVTYGSNSDGDWNVGAGPGFGTPSAVFSRPILSPFDLATKAVSG